MLSVFLEVQRMYKNNKKRLPEKDKPQTKKPYYKYSLKSGKFKMYIAGNLHHTFKLMDFVNMEAV